MNEEMENMLNDDELEKVTGGDELENIVLIGSTAFTGRVKMYDGQLGQNYYLVDDDKDEWFYGQLVDTYELEYAFYTVRTHVFRVTQHNGISCSGVKEFCGDDYSMYTHKGIIRAPSLD